MTILEAIESGFPFKRSSWDNYCNKNITHKQFELIDIISNDWVVDRSQEITLQLELVGISEEA